MRTHSVEKWYWCITKYCTFLADAKFLDGLDFWKEITKQAGCAATTP